MADNGGPRPEQRLASKMGRLWRLASGIAVLLTALFFSTSLVLNVALRERPLPGFANNVLLPVLACVVLFFTFVGSYLLLTDVRKSG
jgi:hypothetical protein